MGTALEQSRGLLARCALFGLALNRCLALQITDGPANDAATSENAFGAGQYLDCSWGAPRRREYEASHSNHSLSDWPCKDNPDFRKLNRKKTIVCVGDSITHGSHLERNVTYPARLHRLLLQEFNVLNLGVSGATAQRARESSYWTFPHLGVAREVGFDVAIVQIGSNDAKTRNWDPSRYRADLLEMVKELAKGHPQAKFILSVPPPVHEANNFTIEAGVVAKTLPDAIRAVQASPDLSMGLVNMQTAFADARQPLQDLLLEDGVHPNEVGYALMSKAAAAAVRRALRTPP